MIVPKKQRISIPLHNMIKVQFSLFSVLMHMRLKMWSEMSKIRCLGNTVRKLCWLQKHVSYLIWSESGFHVTFFFMHMELDDMIKNVKTCHNRRLGKQYAVPTAETRFI